MNAITIYLVDRFFDFGVITKIFVHGFIGAFGAAEPPVWAFGVMLAGWLFLYFLYGEKIFLKV